MKRERMRAMILTKTHSKTYRRFLNVGRLFLSIPFIWSSLALAQIDDLVSINMDGTSKATSAVDAAKEIQNDVISEAVRSRVREILGEKRFQKNRTLVENKIVKQSSKFIPFVNARPPVRLADGSWKMGVEFKLSPSSLRKMILDAGLLNDAEGAAAILPMIAFADREKNSSIRWWVGEAKTAESGFIGQISRQFHEALQSEFSRQGFHIIRPQGTQHSPLPDELQTERPSNSDYKLISDFYQAPMILQGDVRMKEVKEPVTAALCAIKIQVMQAHTGRTIAEVSRQIEADISSGGYENAIRAKLAGELPELTKDLATQVYEVWQRGTLNTNQIRLAVRSPLTPKRVNDFKTGLMGQVQQVKSMRERLFDDLGIQFEIDYSGEREALVGRLKNLELQGFETRLSSVNEDLIAIEVK